MHTGLSVIFQNLGHRSADRAMMRRDLGLIASAEARGFDSVWIPEHHFAGYTVAPNVPMVLAWAAAHSTKLRLGTMVTVLPWHDPVRVAENFSLLDHLSDGRAMLGIGRGLGRKEFDGLRLERGESRRRFTEYADAVLEALETGVMAYDGDLYQQPEVEIRPTPFQTYKGRTFASAVSPESMDLMIKLGCGLMVIAQKPWETTEAEIRTYREEFLRQNAEEAPKPIICVFVGVHESAAEAQRLRDVYLQATAQSITEHYQFADKSFAEVEGYEYYAKLAANIEKHGEDAFNSFLADLQVWGTPDVVTEKLLDYSNRIDAGAVLVDLSFGDMSQEEANRNVDLFCKEVLPHLHNCKVGGDVGVRHSGTADIAAPV
jgi:alkanesulfonate monooxygenase SsuD/methylene tetrahydromethanopterin reductase-like flavin-dependent oxidoreductase (luciferase family)